MQKNGYTIVERNWRFKKYEIDIIAHKDHQICFIEVKTRAVNTLVQAKNALSTLQEKRILTAANSYLQLHEIDLDPRFDLIAITTHQNSLTLEHIKNAFFPTID